MAGGAGGVPRVRGAGVSGKGAHLPSVDECIYGALLRPGQARQGQEQCQNSARTVSRTSARQCQNSAITDTPDPTPDHHDTRHTATRHPTSTRGI